MQPWSNNVAKKFSTTNLFKCLFKNNVCLGNRISIKRWNQSLDLVLHLKAKKSVGIIGMGVLGQDIANVLLDVTNLGSLYLYSRDYEKVKSISYDLRSARPDLKIKSCKNPSQCIKNSDILVISFRSNQIVQDPLIQERQRRLHSHSKLIWGYTRLLRKLNFRGTVLVLTNPVDILSYLTYTYSNMVDIKKFDWNGLLSTQVFGVGIGLDNLRLKVICKTKLELIGEHGDNQYLANMVGKDLAIVNDKKLLNKVKTYSESIRKGTDRTRFGPCHEVKHVVGSIISNDSNLLVLSTMLPCGKFWGRSIRIIDDIPIDEYKLGTVFDKYVNKFNRYVENSICNLLK